MIDMRRVPVASQLIAEWQAVVDRDFTRYFALQDQRRRIAPKPTRDVLAAWKTCCHEIGHALAIVKLGGIVEECAADIGGVVWFVRAGDLPCNAPLADAIIGWSGPIAATKNGGTPEDELSETDKELIVSCIRRLGLSYPDPVDSPPSLGAKRTARELIDRHWSNILTGVGELIHHRVLDGKRVHELFRTL